MIEYLFLQFLLSWSKYRLRKITTVISAVTLKFKSRIKVWRIISTIGYELYRIDRLLRINHGITQIKRWFIQHFIHIIEFTFQKVTMGCLEHVKVCLSSLSIQSLLRSTLISFDAVPAYTIIKDHFLFLMNKSVNYN